jgi:hypothetical protein
LKLPGWFHSIVLVFNLSWILHTTWKFFQTSWLIHCQWLEKPNLNTFHPSEEVCILYSYALFCLSPVISVFLFNNSLRTTQITLQRMNLKGPKAMSERVPALPPKNLSKLCIQRKVEICSEFVLSRVRKVKTIWTALPHSTEQRTWKVFKNIHTPYSTCDINTPIHLNLSLNLWANV